MTVSTTSTICIKYYFNSHPHEEDDRKCLIFYFKTEIFQLTSSRRGWQYTLYFLFNCVNISTHILTKRMTSFPRTCQCIHHFNSHPHEEDDYVKTCNLRTLTHFNSHPHEEDDPAKSCKFLTNGYFNSHPHEEDDGLTLFIKSFNDISTHILTKRMTIFFMAIAQIGIFQLTSSRRGWPKCWPIHIKWITFQLTSSRRGWRRYGEYVDMDNQYFNSHPHEEDDSVSRFLNPSLYISTHILTKRMTTQPILSSTRY